MFSLRIAELRPVQPIANRLVAFTSCKHSKSPTHQLAFAFSKLSIRSYEAANCRFTRWLLCLCLLRSTPLNAWKVFSLSKTLFGMIRAIFLRALSYALIARRPLFFFIRRLNLCQFRIPAVLDLDRLYTGFDVVRLYLGLCLCLRFLRDTPDSDRYLAVMTPL